MRTAIDKSVQLDNINYYDKKVSFSPKVNEWERKSCFYDFGVERNIDFHGFTDKGNSRFVDSLFRK